MNADAVPPSSRTDLGACRRPLDRLLTRACSLLALTLCPLWSSAASPQVFPEVGPDDFEVLSVATSTRHPPALAFDPQLDLFLLVASTEDGVGDPTRLQAQFLDADGTPMGGTFLVATDPIHVSAPAIAHDPVNQRYLVTWFERTGFRVRAKLLNQDGSTFLGPFTVASDCGTTSYWRPCAGEIAYNTTQAGYFVTWHRIEGEFPNYDVSVGARVIGADGSLLTAELTVGTDVDAYGAPPRVAYNPNQDRYLVAWNGKSGANTGIYSRPYTAAGAPSRVSSLVSDEGGTRINPDLVYNPTTDEYLVVWQESTASSGDEIFGQRLDSLGSQIGENDFQISTMGPFGQAPLEAWWPSVAVNPTNARYLVIWRGEDVVDGEFEIHGQYLDGDGTALDPDDFRISDMGIAADPAYDANDPAIAYIPSRDEFLAVWTGDDLTDEDFRGFGQRLHGAGAGLFRDGFESGDLGAWAP